MSEESTTPDLVEFVRQSIDAFNRSDLDAHMSFYAPDAVFRTGVGRFEGRAAIRGYLEDFRESYDDLAFALEEVRELDNAVTLCAMLVTGRLRGTSAEVHLRYAVVSKFTGGVCVRATDYVDIDDAHAAAERLSEERG